MRSGKIMNTNHSPPSDRLEPLLQAFESDDPLRKRVQSVLQALPEEVIEDFLEAPLLHIHPIERKSAWRWSGNSSKRAQGSSPTFLRLPGIDGRCSRCVTLKRKLETDPPQFSRYVIAHELAHAHLHNGRWGDINDREEAADALAAAWGFHRVH
ncbi:MAG: hypothetical protein ACON5J_06175 [Rubripirellula sp.]